MTVLWHSITPGWRRGIGQVVGTKYWYCKNCHQEWPELPPLDERRGCTGTPA